VTIQAPTALTQPTAWKLVDLQGKTVMQGQWEIGETDMLLLVGHLAPGMYQLQHEAGHAKPLRLLKISR
jgi:hypothetical protein